MMNYLVIFGLMLAVALVLVEIFSRWGSVDS